MIPQGTIERKKSIMKKLCTWATAVGSWVAISMGGNVYAQQPLPAYSSSAAKQGKNVNLRTAGADGRDVGKWEFAIEGGAAGTEPYRVGLDDPLCQQVLRYKNEVVASKAHYCNATTRLFPGFSEPPWKELDPKNHRVLISRLLRFAAEGAGTYFDQAAASRRRPNAEKHYLEAADKFIDEGGRIQLWTTSPYEPTQGVIERIRAGEAIKRNLVQLRAPNGPTSKTVCKDPMNYRGIFFVTDDLQAPDPDVSPGFDSYRTIHIFDGRRVLLHEEGTHIVLLDEREQQFSYACHLVFNRNTK